MLFYYVITIWVTFWCFSHLHCRVRSGKEFPRSEWSSLGRRASVLATRTRKSRSDRAWKRGRGDQGGIVHFAGILPTGAWKGGRRHHRAGNLLAGILWRAFASTDDGHNVVVVMFFMADVSVTGLNHMLAGEVRAEVFTAGNVVAQLLDQGLHSGCYIVVFLYGWWLLTKSL